MWEEAVIGGIAGIDQSYQPVEPFFDAAHINQEVLTPYHWLKQWLSAPSSPRRPGKPEEYWQVPPLWSIFLQ